MTDRAPATASAFRTLLDDLRAVAEGLDADQTLTPTDVAEGYRHLLSLLSMAVFHQLESDGERPWFQRVVDPAHKVIGDNGDAVYHMTRIAPDRAYRVWGNTGGAVFQSFTVHAADPNGGLSQELLADVDITELDVGEDGSFELVLSPDERPGNWVPLGAEAASVMVRSYFANDRCAAGDPDLGLRLAIEPLEHPGGEPVPTDDDVARQLADVGRFVRAETIDRVVPSGADSPSFVSREPNVLPTPATLADVGASFAGGADMSYAIGPFVLGPDDALVMEGVLPECRFANVILLNRHMQTLDYRYRTTSLNNRQMHLGDDRRYRVVVSAVDPGVPDWLDTEGRFVGLVFWRFVLVGDPPPRPACTVVKVADLAGD